MTRENKLKLITKKAQRVGGYFVTDEVGLLRIFYNANDLLDFIERNKHTTG